MSRDQTPSLRMSHVIDFREHGDDENAMIEKSNQYTSLDQNHISEAPKNY